MSQMSVFLYSRYMLMLSSCCYHTLNLKSYLTYSSIFEPHCEYVALHLAQSITVSNL